MNLVLINVKNHHNPGYLGQRQDYVMLPVANNKTTFRTNHVTGVIIFHEDGIRMIRTCQRSNFDADGSTGFTENSTYESS